MFIAVMAERVSKTPFQNGRTGQASLLLDQWTLCTTLHSKTPPGTERMSGPIPTHAPSGHQKLRICVQEECNKSLIWYLSSKG